MRRCGFALAAIALFSDSAQAVVALAGTRLIFDGHFTEASIDVSNPGDADVLVQAWIERAETQGSAARALPFVLTPPLAQLAPQARQTLRVLYEGVGMPLDRESLLHLYVLEVPRRSASQQQLSLAIRQRINVFYRPVGLPGDPADAAQALLWQPATGAALSVSNPTPFHVALHQLTRNGVEIRRDLMLGPFSTLSLELPVQPVQHHGPERLTFKALTDYGGLRDFCAQPSGDTPYQARLRAPGDHSSIGKC